MFQGVSLCSQGTKGLFLEWKEKKGQYQMNNNKVGEPLVADESFLNGL